MAAKAWRPDERAVDEVFFRNDAVSLCLLVNRRARTMRIVDFRAGPSSAKLSFILSLAARESVEKVYTLVERDEVATWMKMGFAKEGTIPGFYKRSDAFLLGRSIPGAAAVAAAGVASAAVAAAAGVAKKKPASARVPVQSEMRLAVGDRGERVFDATSSRGVPANGVVPNGGVPNGLASAAPMAPSQLRAERTLIAAKKTARDVMDAAMPAIKLSPMKEADAKKAVAAAVRSARALTAFEPFGRGVQRSYAALTARGGFELVTSVESQSCFGNAFLELLTSPRSDTERLATASALRTMCARLNAEGVVTCFGLAPSDDVRLATAFVANGFRRTGVLENHIVVGQTRKDAMVWSRKLAVPADD